MAGVALLGEEVSLLRTIAAEGGSFPILARGLFWAPAAALHQRGLIETRGARFWLTKRGTQVLLLCDDVRMGATAVISAGEWNQLK